VGDMQHAPARGRPRDASVEGRVLSAVVEELAETGVSGFSINAVSARAKVAKRTIASRWPDRASLILAAMNTLAAGLVPPHTGRLESDLDILASKVADTMAEPRRSILARCAAELREYPQYYSAFKRDSVDSCMAAVEDAIYDARQRDEVRADIDLSFAANSFVSTIIGFYSLNADTNVDPASIRRQFVDLLVRGLEQNATEPTKRTRP
jgi:AcrR family transcriptional regulator